jgi:hypothetical protein
MQRDFHYYAIAVLARAAGFSSRDALIIAYASQYVDDSTEGSLTPLAVQGADLRFDPVRTAYSGLQIGRSIRWSEQKRVWIPFHFLPARPFQAQENPTFSFVTVPDSSFGRWLLSQASSEPIANYRYRLCRIGVALHTYADSWSHEGFSGRHSPAENDVEEIEILDRPTLMWIKLRVENFLFDLLPRIGHAEAGFLPDLAYLQWRYRARGKSAPRIERDNVDRFSAAAAAIYGQLVAIGKRDPAEPIPWEGIAPGIRQLLAGEPVTRASILDRLTLSGYQVQQALDLEQRCEHWKRAFGHLFRPYPPGAAYHYDRRDWRSQALEGDVDWDRYSTRQWETMAPRQPKRGFWDSLWVHFHRAALRQRHLVLENLP